MVLLKFLFADSVVKPRRARKVALMAVALYPFFQKVCFLFWKDYPKNIMKVQRTIKSFELS